MAIKAALTTSRTLRTLSESDSAINRELSDIEAYRSDYNPARLVLVDGEEPTWFTLRPISRDQMQACYESAARTGEQGERWAAALYREVFMRGCTGIEGLVWVDEETGKTVGLRSTGQTERIPGGESVLRADVCRHVPFEVQAELGFVIFGMSRLSEDAAGKS